MSEIFWREERKIQWNGQVPYTVSKSQYFRPESRLQTAPSNVPKGVTGREFSYLPYKDVAALAQNLRCRLLQSDTKLDSVEEADIPDTRMQIFMTR